MKILVIPYTHALSHISRPLLVAQELRKRGHEVFFAGEGPKKRFIEQEGFSVSPLHEPDPDELFGNIRSGKLRFVSDTEIARMIEADLALFKETRPDLVLTDGRFTAPISAHIAGLMHIAIVNVSSTEYRALPYIPFFEWVPERFMRRDTGFWKLLELLNLKLEMLVFDNTMSVFKRLSNKYGLTKTFTATNCLTGKDITLLADVPEYFPTRNLPDNYYYIGPLTWKSAISQPTWWPPERGEKPLIYITMGTTGIGDFFHKVHDIFKASEMMAVVSTGAQIKNLETIVGNIYMEDFIDGDLAMEECSLVICHGGNGTIYQALQHGKPIIGIPTIPDQLFNMRIVEALGIGKTLSWSDFSHNPASLPDAIQSVINNKAFYRQAEKFKGILGRYSAPKTAADIIEKMRS